MNVIVKSRSNSDMYSSAWPTPVRQVSVTAAAPGFELEAGSLAPRCRARSTKRLRFSSTGWFLAPQATTGHRRI